MQPSTHLLLYYINCIAHPYTCLWQLYMLLSRLCIYNNYSWCRFARTQLSIPRKPPDLKLRIFRMDIYKEDSFWVLFIFRGQLLRGPQWRLCLRFQGWNFDETEEDSALERVQKVNERMLKLLKGLGYQTKRVFGAISSIFIIELMLFIAIIMLQILIFVTVA